MYAKEAEALTAEIGYRRIKTQRDLKENLIQSKKMKLKLIKEAIKQQINMTKMCSQHMNDTIQITEDLISTLIHMTTK